MFGQGDTPQFMHIVAKGEFEVSRNKKIKFSLMDPASNIETDNMMKLLKNRKTRYEGKKARSSSDVQNMMGNSLN